MKFQDQAEERIFSYDESTGAAAQIIIGVYQLYHICFLISNSDADCERQKICLNIFSKNILCFAL